MPGRVGSSEGLGRSFGAGDHKALKLLTVHCQEAEREGPSPRNQA